MRLFYLTVLFSLISFLAIAQPGGGDPGGGGNPTVPLTGIEYLLGGGLVLGVKSIFSRYKSKSRQ